MAGGPGEPPANPHDSDTSRENSHYARYDGQTLLDVESGEPAEPLASRVHDALRALVLDPEFPCVGSRSAFNQNSYRFAMYEELNSDAATAGLARDLWRFVQEQPDIEGQFTTFVACFDTPKEKEPLVFERLLWEQLAKLHAVDREPWDTAVSSDTTAPDFSFSFAGRAFFVVGLAPSGERWARTFPWPLLAFNSHEQFEQLRASGRFERMQEVIRDRDEALEGDINPNLSNFGEHTEAKQYSGRAVDHDWRCPVTFTERR